MDKGIGFNRSIFLPWLDAAAAFCAEIDDPSEIRERLEPVVGQHHIRTISSGGTIIGASHLSHFLILCLNANGIWNSINLVPPRGEVHHRLVYKLFGRPIMGGFLPGKAIFTMI